MRPAPRTTCPLLLAALLSIAAPTGAPAADPFYEQLLADGKRALADGRIEEAAVDLEIACFGLLDDPPRLAEGLAHLAVAQQRDADAAGVRETISRILELERSHAGYSRVEIPGEVRAELEEILIANVSPDGLAALDAFRPLAERRGLEALSAARPDRQREVLGERLAAAPDDVRTLQLLAELELEQGAPEAALPYLDVLVELSGGDRSAVCRRLRAAVEAGGCRLDLDDLDTCPEEATRSTAAPEVLACLLASSDAARATTYLASLEPAVRSLPRVRKLERRLERLAASTASAPAPPAPGAADLEPRPVEDEPAAGPPEAATAPPDDQLRALRRQLGRAATAQELALAVSGAVELAESYPASPAAQFLAAEAAYRTARWGEAVRFFEAGGDPDGSQPLLLFYKAVALFELGEADAALAYLERALPKLRKTDFVKSYAERIQAAVENAG